jgi:uncharacterized phage-associated protein
MLQSNSFPFDEEKALAAVLYIINKMNGCVDTYKLVKIIYFADQMHLVTYGRSIVGDEYVPMEYGPVPSTIFNAVKLSNNINSPYKLFSAKLSITPDDNYGWLVKSTNKPDMDELSQSDVECIDISVAENKDLSFGQLMTKSHNQAWKNATLRGLFRIPIEDIARDGGASEDVVSYIKDNIYDHNFTLV